MIHPQPKPKTRKQLKARKKRQAAKEIRAVRAYVFERERGICRCCGWMPAESMHELRPRSLGGKVSRDNSVAVCGDGVRGCHGKLQRHEITYRFDRHRSADYWIAFKNVWGDGTERASDASAPVRITPARTPIERLIDDACGLKR